VSALLSIERLSVGYGSLVAASEVSLELHAGEVVALFGPNGAGKTSVLMGAVGVLPRRTGTVRFGEAPAPDALYKLARAGLALVPEKRAIISSLSTLDNLRLGQGTVEAALGHFPELEEHLDRPAALLSGGQQQILMLARALAGRPRALLVDELSLGLAPQVVERLLLTLRRAADEEGLGVLLVEQQVRRALSVADRWYLLNRGRMAAAGEASDAATGGLEDAYLESMGITPELE
jgi:branched-chain amino acid transport system ATP-binding protein